MIGSVIAIVFAALSFGLLFAMLAVSFVRHPGRQLGSDGYPHNITRHKDRCQCVRCIGMRDRMIRQLEIDLGMRDPDPEPEGRAIIGAKIRAETITADKIQTEWAFRPNTPIEDMDTPSKNCHTRK